MTDAIVLHLNRESLRAVLNRALNTLAPEKYPAWAVELSDALQAQTPRIVLRVHPPGDIDDYRPMGYPPQYPTPCVDGAQGDV